MCKDRAGPPVRLGVVFLALTIRTITKTFSSHTSDVIHSAMPSSERSESSSGGPSYGSEVVLPIPTDR